MVKNAGPDHTRIPQIPARQPFFSMQIHHPETLPVTAHRQEIIDLLSSHQVIIIAGETGSGKTTQIPKICLEHAGRTGC